MSKNYLIAPLDWGLGHATRCIPVINYLLQQKYQVFIAADGKTEALLRAEFPNVTYLKLKGYDVQYTTKKWLLPFYLLLQIPKLIKAVKHENKWLQQQVDTYGINVVVSDNRYGLYSAHTKNIFITHQLTIKAPFLWAERALQLINYVLINKFSECWVPDFEERPYLAGKLSHPYKRPKVPLYYTGPLSRFKLPAQNVQPRHLLITLSGPEPQRSILEQKLLNMLHTVKEPVVFVRGLPGAETVPKVPAHVTIHNHLPAIKMEEAMLHASYVIARCGYSTVMDLMVLRKKSILIPTPGQTEQEYLAKTLMQQGFTLSIAQHNFNLSKALKAALQFNYQLVNSNDSTNNLQKVFAHIDAK